MAEVEQTVGNLMVSSPITVEPWQPVAHARQLMLMHSFSFLPVRLGESWCLVSELRQAKYLSHGARKTRLSESIATAHQSGMEVEVIEGRGFLRASMPVGEVLADARVQDGPMLWLVVEEQYPERLAGVLSPFELM